MRLLRKVSSVISGCVIQFGNAGAVLAGVTFLLLVVLTLISVVMRGVFGRAFMDVVTLGRIAMIVVGFLTAAYTLRHGRHVSIDFVVDRLSGPLSRRLRIFGLLGVVVAMAVIMAGSFEYAVYAMEMNVRLMSEFDLPTWPFQMIIPIGLAMLIAQLLIQIVGEIRSGFDAKDKGRDTLAKQ